VDWEAYIRDAESDYGNARTLDEVSEVNVKYQGRKSPLKLQLREVRDRETGHALQEKVDVTLPARLLGDVRPRPRGHLHPTTLIRRDVEDAFIGLGYEIRDDREIETLEYNFDKLAFPPWHPARSPRDTYFLDANTVLRTETSASQIHAMEERKPPIYMVSIGRVYRRDAINQTHFPIFHQFEGLAVDRHITLADLKGTLLHVMRALFGEDRRVRFRTNYFPFTEPSMEPDVSCGVCGGEGCPTCKFSGWIEIGGCGMVDPQVLLNVGLDPEEWSGFAFGLGLERTAQLRYDIPTIRPFWENDLRFLEQF
jgi:phenylalanyl-tRNA synthetase alpha chain